MKERERGQTKIRTCTVVTYRESHASSNMQSTVSAAQRFSCGELLYKQHQRCHRWHCHGGVMWRSMCSGLETRRRRRRRRRKNAHLLLQQQPASQPRVVLDELLVAQAVLHRSGYVTHPSGRRSKSTIYDPEPARTPAGL